MKRIILETAMHNHLTSALDRLNKKRGVCGGYLHCVGVRTEAPISVLNAYILRLSILNKQKKRGV